MGVEKVSTADEYNKSIGNPNVCVLFSADWAEQCAQIKDAMTTLSAQLPSMKFVEVPAEELSDISLKHQVEAVPTVIFFQNGKAVDRIDGIDIVGLTTKCKNLVGVAEETKDKLEERLKMLINKAKVMIFMKGDRNMPRCGFSKQLIAIINDTKVAYETFDILTDEAVRQGLKTYSDWPTYPQVYVNGELIGGLDIIKELLANGELTQTLNG
ncbi:glutaredoxin 3 [Culicoides brevitarsis]|uniref:glutaredoxin 3 n=1 Tax=Culicoides brevitarsis TaxID=469753 RepID=UPI00307B4902